MSLTFSALAFDEDHKEKINGTNLHFRVRGSDKSHPYLLILHGGPGFSSHMFYPWGPSIENDVNVVYLDQRGSGQSDKLKIANPYLPKAEEVKGYTIAALLNDIEGVRTFLHIDKWFVLGHSWGGMLGLEYVVSHPAQVSGFIDMDGLISVPLMETEMIKSIREKSKLHAKSTVDDDVEHALVESNAAARLEKLDPTNPFRLIGLFGIAMGSAELYFYKDQGKAYIDFNQKITEAVKPYGLSLFDTLYALEPSAALNINDHYLTRNDIPLLSKVTVPTLIINGKQDGVVTPATAVLAHQAISKSKLIILDNCGHFPFVEQPEKTATAIHNFVIGTH